MKLGISSRKELGDALPTRDAGVAA